MAKRKKLDSFVKVNGEVVSFTDKKYYADEQGNLYSGYKKLSDNYKVCGYICNNLIDNNGKRHKLKRHRVVMFCFKNDKYFDGCVVNHIDEDKSNNNIENLKFCIVEENNKHGTAISRGSKKKSKKKKSKTKKPVVRYGRRWDSQLELDFFEYLKETYPDKGITLQPEFILQESFKKDGKTIRPIIYIGDFRIDDIVYDSKGFADSYFKLKQKMMWKVHPEVELKVMYACPNALKGLLKPFLEEDLYNVANKAIKAYKKDNEITKLTKRYYIAPKFVRYMKEALGV